ncbi:putative cinnamyl alcohol dehydrogenase 4 [Hibiscus syriacus]|uniref:cinnamyl-alcohol dehydrogenase n=1 Tax=Hibiscus syriacus TaxID=106335 RepID=A0A6A2Y249_HIBSY|nr:putative cinnamyl alcohol dehydrogenase 4 [Hibiscus syriacus]
MINTTFLKSLPFVQDFIANITIILTIDRVDREWRHRWGSVGIVKEVGSNVQRFKVGDPVEVGTYINSCRDCEYCNDAWEIHCDKGTLFTFNAVDADGTVTKGGYSSSIVVHERYCFKIPSDYPLASAAPLLCAGVTVYTPMILHNMNQPRKSLGVIRLGGLDHMAVKLQGFWVECVYALSGFPSEVRFSPGTLNLRMRTSTGSVTGGTNITQEMIVFCAAKKIYPQMEVIPIQYATEALERLIKRDVKYRFVIDIENSL